VIIARTNTKAVGNKLTIPYSTVAPFIFDIGSATSVYPPMGR
jgi:hypothetical protein